MAEAVGGRSVSSVACTSLDRLRRAIAVGADTRRLAGRASDRPRARCGQPVHASSSDPAGRGRSPGPGRAGGRCCLGPALPPARLGAPARPGARGDEAIVVYRGGFQQERGLDGLAEAILTPGLETATLVYLGFGPEQEALERLAAESRFGGRIHVLPAVPSEELLDWVADADV